MASVSPARINSNSRIAPATPTTSRQAALSASPAAAAGIIPSPNRQQSSPLHSDPPPASTLHGRTSFRFPSLTASPPSLTFSPAALLAASTDIADFNGQTSFLTTDGRVKNPVPSKLQGMADNKNGNFAVMHIDLGHSEKSMRNDAAKRTSEGTEAAARIANQAGYQPVKRSKLAWQPPDTDLSQTAIGLSPHEAKAEQVRLLSLLRAVSPAIVAEQLCKAVAFFGGLPDAPAPDTMAGFPQSLQSNGSGSQFVSWLAEIFPASDPSVSRPQPQPQPQPPTTTPLYHDPSQKHMPPMSSQPPAPLGTAVQADGSTSTHPKDAASETVVDPNAPAVPVKRGRGRPKGSKGKPKNRDQLPTNDSDPAAVQNSQDAHGSWPGQSMHPSQHRTPGQSETGTPGKKRGRPKGSKNKPKNTTPGAQSGTELTPSQDADESQDSFLSPMAQIPNSLSLSQDGSRPNSGPLGLHNVIEPSNAHAQSSWTSVGMQSGQNAAVTASRKRKSDKSQPDAVGGNSNMLPAAHQDSAHAIDSNGKRRRFSKDNAVFGQMGPPSRMNSSESPVQNSSFQSPSQQMVPSGSFDPAQQPTSRKPGGARTQPPSRPGQPQPQQQQPFNPAGQPQPHQSFNQQQPPPQAPQQPFNQPPGQHKSPVIGGNQQPQPPSGSMDLSGSSLSRSVMYNQQQQQQFQHFINQQRLSVDMNTAANSPGQFSQGSGGGKSPMYPQGHMVRDPSGDTILQNQQRPSTTSQSAQLTHDGSRMGSTGFPGRASPATTAGTSPSINSPFTPGYASRNYLGMNYGSMGGGRVPDNAAHPFGGSAGQMDTMGNTDPTNMRNRMYQTMHPQQQQQRQ